MVADLDPTIRHATAVLGPTNTGKTHLAIERMLAHQSGMIGLPLRLLAREVYDRVVGKVGAEKVALITGEEKIKPQSAKYWVSTVEAMPLDVGVDFLAVDEIQLCSDPERGYVFTDRLLNARGRSETLLLGAQTMRDIIRNLIPGANFVSRPRLSKLTYAGEKKITRLQGRSAVIAFSANEVYSIAELIRRQRGGAAVVLGALSPRTRNAQVALYQSGDVNFLVATDAIGMGLNLDVDHVAFSGTRKFDGQDHRELTPSELAQIAGRAGRHMNDGTFGVTGTAQPFEAELVEKLETHTFDPVRVLQWRARKLDYATIDALLESLRAHSDNPSLVRARSADDVIALETVARDADVTGLATNTDAVEKLWSVCQVPDYRKISSQNHADLIASLYKYLMSSEGIISEDWFAAQVAFGEKTDGDIDTLANRIAHVRTWTFVANQSGWLKDPEHWQQKTRDVEDRLSDALHERLMQRFVDKRTSALMKGMRDKEELNAQVLDDGSIKVEDHFVGRLKGFLFLPDGQAEGIHGKAARNAAMQVLSGELAMRARQAGAAKSDAFQLSRQGSILWRGEEIARIEAAEDPLKPSVRLLVDEHMSTADKERVEERVAKWVREVIDERLKPLVDMSDAEDVSGLARGIAFRLKENLGILRRDEVSEDIKLLDQPARAQLRKYGVRFGAFNVYVPILLKPAPMELCATLWALRSAGDHDLDLNSLPEPPRAGLTSVSVDSKIPAVFYKTYGYHICGPRAVRLDILERLADKIRPKVAYRKTEGSEDDVPEGATGDGGFIVTTDMMSILGCSSDELGSVLEALGFRKERRPISVANGSQPNAVAASKTDGDGGRGGEAENALEPQADAIGGGSESTNGSVEEANAFSDIDVSERTKDAVASDDVTGSGEERARANKPSESSEEPAFEEIWRPIRNRRKRAGGRPHHRLKKKSAKKGDVDSNAGQVAAPVKQNGGTRGGADAVSADGQAAVSSNGDKQNKKRRKSGKRRHLTDGEGRKQRAKKQSKRGSEQNQRKAGGRISREFSASPPRSDAGLDPDSPFAALGALKDSLEKGAEEEGSK